MRILPLLLIGCLGPSDASVCFENIKTSADICELELSADELDQRQSQCDYNTGYVQSVGCAHEYQVLSDCVSNAIAGQACDNLDEAINKECAYLSGRLSGCLPPNAAAQ